MGDSIVWYGGIDRAVAGNEERWSLQGRTTVTVIHWL